MGDLDRIISMLPKIDDAIEDALKQEVADVVKKAIVDSARKNVYDAYTPIFYSRRNGAGGILDPNSVKIEAHGSELVAWDAAEWQQLWGGRIPEISLAEALASGSERFNFQRAGPRPFHEQAKEYLIQSGELERALRQGLARQGYDTSNATFTFI